MPSAPSDARPGLVSARGAAIALAAVVAVGAAGWGVRDRLVRAVGGAAAAAPEGVPSANAPPKAPPPVTADGLRVEPQRIADTVRTTGTLLALDQVDLVAEISRRIVQVKARDGAMVKKGDVLFVLDAADLVAQARTLEVRRKLAVENEKRALRLSADGLTSAQEVDRLVAERALAEAQLAELGVAISRSTLRAPFAGKVGLVQVSEGAWVSPSTLLATLQDLRRVRIDFSLPERYASALREGGRFTFHVPGREAAFEGVLTAVEPRIDAATRSVVARGVADNPKQELLPGGFVTVELELSADERGLAIPTMAVIPTAGGHSVFVARDGKAVSVPVELGVRGEQTVQILSGLAAGDVVLTTNLLRLRPGVPVQLGTVDGAEQMRQAPQTPPSTSAPPAASAAAAPRAASGPPP